ncbi:unnamed protein product [Gongylonema pulchrum]|uniref:Glycosylphosphatidylinositol anchor attachment 1 protein n=1 Tax=Gongylonema pulchrum TaxID=637853 RepID=A0A183EAN9_9BILA|nr:unnamed protein product [Gongylonema pulchrum]
MRSLSESIGKPPIIVAKLVSKWRLVCLLSEILALAYMGIIIQPGYNESTRISENALLPALVTERFTSHQRISAFLKGLHATGNVAEYIKKQLQAYGIFTQMLHFEATLPGFNNSGTNVLGVVRASRSSSVEAILMAVNMNDMEALAVAMALATYCREQVYWARDIHFVFVDKGLVGMTAFLDEYHGHRHPFLRVEKLQFHSGAVVGGFALKTTGTVFDTLNVEHNMMNGLLPNLDLLNLMIKLADKFGLVPEVFESAHQGSWWDLAELTSSAVLSQAFNEKEGLHSVFGSYGIQAVTIHAQNVFEGYVTLTDLARICEGALRSLNNILEKFHQSYFLYIMTGTRRFLSVAYYMPALGFVLFPLFVLALRDWFSMIEFKFSNSFLLLHVIGIVEYCVIRSVATSEEEVVSLRFLFYLDYCLIFGSLSLLNFSLALFISLIAVPLIILFTAVGISNRLINRSKAVFGFLLHPIALHLFCYYFLYNVVPTKAYVEQLVTDLITNHLLFGSFLFPFIFICLLPLWNLLILISSSAFS